jgi:hypothetical protein
MNREPVDYSGIPPMTGQERKTAKSFYKDFLDKLPPEMVKELVEKRLADVKANIPETVAK